MEPNITSQTAQPAPETQTPVTQPIQTIPSNSSKTKYILLSVFILLIIFLVGGGAYYLGGANQKSSSQKNTNQTTSTTASPTLTPIPTIQTTPTSSSDTTAGWKTYVNNKGDIGEVGFTIKYPDIYNVITGQQITKRDNPQIGIPYNFLKITQEEKTNDFVLMVGVKDTSDILMPTSITYTDKVINGMTFKQYTNNNNFMEIGKCNAYGYVIEKNNSIYNLFTCDTDTATFDKMMSTLQFTTP